MPGRARRVPAAAAMALVWGSAWAPTTNDGISQEPELTAKPNVGLPGTPIVVDGHVPCCLDPSSWPIVWEASGKEVGSATVQQDGVIHGTATIPFDVVEGTGHVSACGPVESKSGCVTAAFDVLPPTISADPGEVTPGSRLRISGDGWCCVGDDGAVTETVTGNRWGAAAVDVSGRLVADATVPADAATGPVDLDVCLPGRCAIVTISVVAGSSPAAGSSSTPPIPAPAPAVDTSVAAPSSGTDAPLPADGDEDVEPIADVESPEPWMILLAVGAAMAVGAVLVLALHRALRQRRVPDTPARVQIRPESRPPTLVGRDRPDLSISAVLDPGEGTAHIRERQLQ